ncbi:3-hexulose-6-phosphate synthase [Tetragenococcus halophilus subsp. flandriensis]|uniref:3-hexulose-6-phosphate synthase n=1 Tax=Tetragenococcus halophilus TaxID=51669 RepID=UPI0023E9D5B6|nr:3-hexulose-6-phosphate synthase [Tetragenococcus halophilus]GMA09108.1 3-hexulose-6-phosphate synthase [Tetragenococcus halophilus subsp. flandriensis]
MKLQLAIDTLNLSDAIRLIDDLYDYIDIIEIGTPLVLLEGTKATEVISNRFPEKEVLCDAKIMDAGSFESQIVFEAGADYVTILGLADDKTLEEYVDQARKYDKKVVVDMINVENIDKRVPKLEEIGVDVIAVHTGVDRQALGRTPLDDLKEIKKYASKTKIAVAGGINENTIDKYIKVRPDIVIVGSGITSAELPQNSAERMYKAIQKYR